MGYSGNYATYADIYCFISGANPLRSFTWEMDNFRNIAIKADDLINIQRDVCL